MSGNTVSIEKIINSLELIEDSDEFEEAFATVSLNPTVKWAKFILLDDLPNANNQRIPQEEFDNIIKTGAFMPIKMAEGTINDGHDLSKPLGVITHLKKIGNQIKGLAALWTREREEDVQLVERLYQEGKNPQLSWEILYTHADDEDGGVIKALRNTALRAVTLVGLPAYQGRTPIIAMAAKWSTEYINDLPDSSFLYIESGGEKDEEGKTTTRSLRHLPVKDAQGRVDIPRVRNAINEADQIKIKDGKYISPEKAEELKNKARTLLKKARNEASADILEQFKEDFRIMDEIEKLQAEVETLKTAIKTLEDKNSELETSLTQASQEKESLSAELTELREFKAGIDAEKERDEKLAELKQKFSDAGIEKDDTYFEEKAELLLGLSEEALEYFLQELVSFGEASASKNDEDKTEVPNVTNTSDTPSNPRELALILRTKKK